MPSPQPLEPGRLVAGRYRIAHRLGGGGMGDVYCAEHTLAGRMVALKLLRADLAADENATRRWIPRVDIVHHAFPRVTHRVFEAWAGTAPGTKGEQGSR